MDTMLRRSASLWSGLTLLAAALMLPSRCPGAEAQGAKGLPEAAATVLKASFPKATIMEVEREREHGVLYFEVELREDGQKIEVEVGADGKIGEIETKMTAKDLPEAVAARAQTVAAGGEIGAVEKHEIRGVALYGSFVALAEPLTVYEVTYRAPGAEHRSTMVIRGNGELLRAAPDGGDDDDDDDDEGDDD